MTIPAQPSQPTQSPDSGSNPTSEVTVDPAPQEDVVIQEVAPKPKVISVPTHAMKRIKDEAAKEGRIARDKELDATAQELGYKNHAEWIEASKAARAASQQPAATKQPVTDPAASQQPQATSNSRDPEVQRLMQENQRLAKERDTALEDKKRSNRQFSRQKRELDRAKEHALNLETESELKLAAKDAGVTDVDYAVTVFQRSIQGKTEAELKDFDYNKFFSETLRQTHPHIYQAVDRPVQTGVKSDPKIQTPGTGGKAPEPGKGDPSNGKPKSALTMTPQEFQDKLRSLNLNLPGRGGMMA